MRRAENPHTITPCCRVHCANGFLPVYIYVFLFFFVAVCHLPFLFVPRLCCHYHQQFNKWLLAENDITLTRYAYSYVWSLQATTGYQLLLHTIQSYCSYAASSHNFTHPTTRQLRFTNMRSRVTVCTVVFLNSIPSLLLATHSHTLRNAARTNKCQMNKKKNAKKEDYRQQQQRFYLCT